MYVHLSCDPPLGQSTVIPAADDVVSFTVLLETDVVAEGQPWEVVLWHSFAQAPHWEPLPLTKSPVGPHLFSTDSANRPKFQRHIFKGDLPGKPSSAAPVRFTLKFRSHPDEPWKWVNDHHSKGDGELCYLTLTPQSTDLGQYINNLDPALTIRQELSQVPETTLWYLTTPVIAANGRKSGFTTTTLGRPSSFSRWFALVRLWSPWLSPEHGQGAFAAHKDGLLSAFLRCDGLHLVLLAVSGIDDVLTLFRSDGEGNVLLAMRNDSEAEGIGRVVAAVGKSFETAKAAAMYHARKLVMGAQVVSGEAEAEMKALVDGVKPEWLEDWYDGFTYCTWNGLGRELTEERILAALDDLEKAGIKISNLIIDDNWQSLEGNESPFSKGWTEFEADRVNFPKGLKHTISEIRSRHSHIKHIGVWHALMGYWGGISPHGKIAKTYKTVEVPRQEGFNEHMGKPMTVVDAEDIQRFYDDCYRFLSSCGVDSVKADVQFYVDLLDAADDRRRLIKAYQDAWSISSLRYFSIKTISCMSQAPQILFHSLLPSNKPQIMVRNSDDFFPDIPASHPWHIFCNAHNALFTQHLNALPDWDMFQTSHPYSSFHAAARCVSGGPIYVTDVPGQHDFDLVVQMTAPTPRGNTVILRPSTIGKTTEAYAGYNEQKLLKIATYTGRAETGSAILGIFNVSETPLVELLPLREFPGTEEGEYVVHSHRTGEISQVAAQKDKVLLVDLEVPVKGWEILTACPVVTLDVAGKLPIRLANFGLLGKMTGAAAIVNTDIYVADNGRVRFWTSLKALGDLGLYVSDLEKRSIDDDFMVIILGKPIPRHTISKGAVANVLEIDVKTAWEELGWSSGWSNEVQVEIFIHV